MSYAHTTPVLEIPRDHLDILIGELDTRLHAYVRPVHAQCADIQQQQAETPHVDQLVGHVRDRLHEIASQYSVLFAPASVHDDLKDKIVAIVRHLHCVVEAQSFSDLYEGLMGVLQTQAAEVSAGE